MGINFENKIRLERNRVDKNIQIPEIEPTMGQIRKKLSEEV